MSQFLIKTLSLILATLPLNQELRPIFDARKNPEPAKATVSEQQLLKREVLPIARKFWEQDCECESFDLVDVAEGAFTESGTKQKAILYTCCVIGHGFTRQGIAILDAGKIVAHVVYDGVGDIAIGALPDIDANGKSEILMANFYMNTGSEMGGISIIELTDKGIKKYGQAITYEGNCSGQTDQKKGKVTAYKVYVIPSTIPQFYAETFTQKGCDSKMEKIGAVRKTVLDKDEVNYRRMK